MAVDRSPIGKQSRREGVALHNKAHKILAKKGYKPGQHGRGFSKKLSEYGVQMREKQKIRRSFGLLEKQFSKLVHEATRSTGQSGHNLMKFLELRIDNTIYRAGFASSRREARQKVGHGHFMLNGKRVTIPSLRLSEGVTVRDQSAKTKAHENLAELQKGAPAPSWMKVDVKKKEIAVSSLPTREHTTEEFNEQFVIEFYSR
jgi:small subunit ribosomal protein S4